MPSSPEPLSGQHAVVTGGGRGIGAAIAVELARLGANLTLMGRTIETLTAHRDAILLEHEREIATVVVDVTDAASVEQAFAMSQAALGVPNILVNNAGTAESRPFRRTTPEQWSRMIDINLTGPALCAARVVEGMVDAGYGRIVTIASTAGLKGYAYVVAYAAAKHGAIGFTRSLALELATSGVTVNAVCPGFTDTDLTAASIETIVARTGRSAEDARAELSRFNPQKRLIEPREVARVVGWLALPESSAITGQAIVVAGGEV
jgi:NAD(P)-dependent dehydrogenase (short-subunit alcohol dehydrogenase family)